MKPIEKLRESLPQFEWTQETETSSIFGVIIAPTTYVRINKHLHILNNVNVFISSEMGGTKDNPKFHYGMCYQRGEVRPYRHKNFSGVEYNKLFVSAESFDSIIDKLINEIDLSKYFLPQSLEN